MFALLATKHLFTLLNGGQWPATTPEEPCCNIDSVWGCDFAPSKPLGAPGNFFCSVEFCPLVSMFSADTILTLFFLVLRADYLLFQVLLHRIGEIHV